MIHLLLLNRDGDELLDGSDIGSILLQQNPLRTSSRFVLLYHC